MKYFLRRRSFGRFRLTAYTVLALLLILIMWALSGSSIARLMPMSKTYYLVEPPGEEIGESLLVLRRGVVDSYFLLVQGPLLWRPQFHQIEATDRLDLDSGSPPDWVMDTLQKSDEWSMLTVPIFGRAHGWPLSFAYDYVSATDAFYRIEIGSRTSSEVDLRFHGSLRFRVNIPSSDYSIPAKFVVHKFLVNVAIWTGICAVACTCIFDLPVYFFRSLLGRCTYCGYPAEFDKCPECGESTCMADI